MVYNHVEGYGFKGTNHLHINVINGSIYSLPEYILRIFLLLGMLLPWKKHFSKVKHKWYIIDSSKIKLLLPSMNYLK